ncbi:MAG: hypothetical protein B6242_08085 [Anaerolineaceae bacterium 4572_78]|nr:MAG: hypothetical protein B6242_08085 [Anaerolineaceae bacterium 4572_78]
MLNISHAPILANISQEGYLQFSAEQLHQLGLQKGDNIVLSVITPGQVMVQKIQRTLPPSKEALNHLIRQAFHSEGYHSREQIVDLMRQVRREIASEAS